ncbi:MAG: alpha-L-fucosidase [Limisphaerales bacterium]
MKKPLLMSLNVRYILSFQFLATTLLSFAPAWQSQAGDIDPPGPYGPVPSTRQLQWHEMEFYGLIHFGMNTFSDKEWGAGDEPPELFNPSAFDAGQIARTAREAGMRGLILVCKHHDGFCLWPSLYTEHSVKHSPWRGGKGDMVKEVADACRKEGLKFGVYLSPWDRNHKDYGRAEYLPYYRNLLREVLTNYGDVFVAWFDGACGGVGFYGGARDDRKVDGRTYYGWGETWSLVRSLQPNAVIFSDAGPDVRWVGNERGLAGDPCWGALDLAGCYPGMTNCHILTAGHRSGTNWVPPECDVPIRPHWFYHAHQDRRVKSAPELVDIYYQSVGRGASLDLGLAPDKRGLIPEPDVVALQEMRRLLDATFATNLAATAKLTASNVRGGADRFGPANLLDKNRETFWTTDDEAKTPELVVDFGKPVTFSVVRLREYLPLGQRVEAFTLDQWQDGGWRELVHGTSIGNQRLLHIYAVKAEKVRLRITQAAACPALSEFGLFTEPQETVLRTPFMPRRW